MLVLHGSQQTQYGSGFKKFVCALTMGN